MGGCASDRSWPSHDPANPHARRSALAHVKTAVLLMLCLAAGCSWHPWRTESPSRSKTDSVVYDANRNRVITQCSTRRDTSAMVIPGKRDRDGSYASHYESCL